MTGNPLLLLNRTRESAAQDIVPVTTEMKSNSVNLTTPGRAIRCRGDGAGGALKITTGAGSDVATYIASGETLVVDVIRIWTTGTAATNLEILT